MQMDALEWFCRVLTEGKYRKYTGYDEALMEIFLRIKKEGKIKSWEAQKILCERVRKKEYDAVSGEIKEYYLAPRTARYILKDLEDLEILDKDKEWKGFNYTFNLKFIQYLKELYKELKP